VVHEVRAHGYRTIAWEGVATLLRGVSNMPRRTVRFWPTTGVRIEINGTARRARLKDVSLGGFGMVARQAFQPGLTCHVRLATDAGVCLRISAKVVYSTFVNTSGGWRFVTGFQFLGAGTETAIAQFIEAVTQPETSPAA